MARRRGPSPFGTVRHAPERRVRSFRSCTSSSDVTSDVEIAFATSTGARVVHLATAGGGENIRLTRRGRGRGWRRGRRLGGAPPVAAPHTAAAVRTEGRKEERTDGRTIGPTSYSRYTSSGGAERSGAVRASVCWPSQLVTAGPRPPPTRRSRSPLLRGRVEGRRNAASYERRLEGRHQPYSDVDYNARRAGGRKGGMTMTERPGGQLVRQSRGDHPRYLF